MLDNTTRDRMRFPERSINSIVRAPMPPRGTRRFCRESGAANRMESSRPSSTFAGGEAVRFTR